MHIWIVSAVPMYCGSPSSVTHEENCAESATTVAPQIVATSNSSTGFPPYKSPITRQQVPLIAMAHDVTVVRPMRSAISPASTQPTEIGRASCRERVEVRVVAVAGREDKR